ncbi:MAG: DUF3422 domain-containing protein [Gammaproteobacteria bacterium]|nr:DUF3422 domain-containing protein [Gammaproteobacteria bacterium]
MSSGSVDQHRQLLNAELHARPFMTLAPPARLWHHALLLEGDGLQASIEALRTLYERHDMSMPAVDGNQLLETFPEFRLRWERHAEFVTITFILEQGFDPPFGSEPVLQRLQHWIRMFPGERVLAVTMSVWPADAPGFEESDLTRHFETSSLCGAICRRADARIWTDFRIHPDGYERIAVKDCSGDERRLGALVQRLLELSDYRALALLGLPTARRLEPKLREVGDRLYHQVSRIHGDSNLDSDHALLEELIALSAEMEDIGAASAFRFSATSAYRALVKSRLASLQEEPLRELETLDAFLSRRFDPAMRTIDSVSMRQERLARRIARAASLLSTRVECAMERQSRMLLSSMARHARMQLRLQQTVEGLSLAAIAYYVVGLVGYVSKPVADRFFAGGLSLVQALSVPVVVLVCWHMLRRRRRSVEQDDAGHDSG